MCDGRRGRGREGDVAEEVDFTDFPQTHIN